MLEVDESRAGGHRYFEALRAEANSGGVEAMLNFLLKLKSTTLIPSCPPDQGSGRRADPQR